MKREVTTCDVCDRELPLRGIKGQSVRQVKRAWHWHSMRPDESEPEHICCECWGEMVATAREIRERAGA